MLQSYRTNKHKLSLLLGLLIILHIPLKGLTIGEVAFRGLENTDDTVLLRASGLVIGQPYDPLQIPEATNRLYAFLNSQGRYFVRIPAPDLIPLDDGKIKLQFMLREMLPSNLVQIRLQGMNYFSEAKLYQLLLISPEQSVPLDKIPLLQQQIVKLYNSRAYLFAAVKLDSLVKEDNLVAYLGISEGKPMRINDYIFRGNKVTRDRTLLSLSGLQSVKTITPEVLKQAEESILRKSYIRDCVVEPLDEGSVLIRVEEGRMTFLEGVLGMSSINSELRLSGQMRLQFLNLWGSDRAIKLFWKQLPSRSSELSISYHESGYPGFPMAADIEIFRAEQDSTWIKSKAALQVYYSMLRQNVGLDISTEDISPGSRRPVIIESASLYGIGAFWNYSNVEGGVNPYKGTQLNLLYRLNKQDGIERFYGSTEAGAKAYVQMGSRFVGYVGVQIRNLENSELAAWSLYKMGGYGSLRGYNEDEFSSYRLAWTNYELRYRLSADSRIYMLFDQGFMGLVDKRLKYDIFGFGIGMKINTRLGILGVEYALGYRDKRFSSLGLGMIHAGLDLAF